MSENLLPCPFCGGRARVGVSGEGTKRPAYKVFCRNIKDCGCSFEFFDTEEEAIAAWNRRADGWIPVSEGLPEKDLPVLLFLDNQEHTKITTGKRYISDDAKYDGEYCIGFDPIRPDFLKRQVITHWMPLPSPPKGVERDE